jgi:hypothetical protein
MNAYAVSSAADEINRLHAVVLRCASDSRKALCGSLAAAWRAGQLLVAEKKRVRRTMGGGAWLMWLERNFDGSPRTAQRYMRLAACVSDAAFLRGMSVRQAYLRLGIATEPKSRAESPAVPLLPEPVRLASRLIAALRADYGDVEHVEKSVVYREDLRRLYEQLRPLFEPSNDNSPHAAYRSCPSHPHRAPSRFCAG